ncbi:MAG: hypothetical protein WCX80_02555 [Patescibacteria group bacterium]
MKATLKDLKIKMTKLAKDFSEEENIFQRTLAIFKFIEVLQKNKDAKKALDSLLSKTSNEMDFQELSNEDDLLCEKAGIDCDFWVCYGALDKVHTLILKFKETEDKRYANKAIKMVSASYYPEIYGICFKMVAGCLLEKMETDYLLANKKDKEEKTCFNSQKSILYVKGFKIMIARQDKETNAHKILKYIFKDNKDNLKDNFFYSEIAEDVFEDLEYKDDKNSWKRYYDSCEKINKKVFEGTKRVVENFLIFNSGKRGCLKINPEYL